MKHDLKTLELEASTRQALIQAAGQIFAEAGFRNATVRQICQAARANVAAVNYHFGDKSNLYLEVLRQAHRGANTEFPLRKINPALSPEARLELFIETFLRRLILRGPNAWMAKIMSREMIEPTPALEIIVNEEIRPNAMELEGIIRDLLGQGARPEKARLCAMSVVSQCLFYHHCRPVIQVLFPQIVFTAKSIKPIAAHISRFSIAALRDFARGETRKQSTPCKMKIRALSIILAHGITATTVIAGPASRLTAPAPWPDHPVSLVEALNLAESHNGTIVKAKKDLEASAGVVIQTKAIAIPKVQLKGLYQDQDRGSVDTLQIPAPFAFSIVPPHQIWNVSIQLVQSVYEGGRMTSAFRAARLTGEQAVAQYQSVLNDTFLDLRTTYYDVLLAEKQIEVEEASVQLLGGELNDANQRFAAGTVPSFNVLRAKVQLANEKPKLIKARNNLRVSKNNLANLMGFHLPKEAGEDIPLRLEGRLEVEQIEVELPGAIMLALQNRPELTALRKNEKLREEDVISARAGLKPSVQVFGGYADRNSQFTSDISRDLEGWQAGVQLNWNLFDGFLTRGKVMQMRALKEKAAEDLDDGTRRIELEVRSAYSEFVEAKEVLASQEEVVHEAEEALRLATARNQAGTGTQLDVLDAQTSLTQSRITQIQSTRDYEVAVARLERATGHNISQKH